jgi:hypothetical protein
VPRISQFYGISVYMYFDDHAPPHIHAIYGDTEAAVSLSDGSILAGDLPRRAAKLTLEWMKLHEAELMDNWRRAVDRRPLRPINPLT